jgi:hypothetical protein
VGSAKKVSRGNVEDSDDASVERNNHRLQVLTGSRVAIDVERTRGVDPYGIYESISYILP